jgi:hypothetical protein
MSDYQTKVAEPEPEDCAPSKSPSLARLLFSAAEDGVYLVLRPGLRAGPLGAKINGSLHGAHGERELTANLAIVGLDADAKRQWREAFAGREAELRAAVIALLGAV